MKKLLVAIVAFAGLSVPLWAATVEEQVLAALRNQGYVILEQGYTFLGRLRIVAENGRIHREIVVNPGTGEILRDYAISMPLELSPAKPDHPASAAVASVERRGTGSQPRANPAREPAVSTATSTVAGVTGILDGASPGPMPSMSTAAEDGSIVVELPESILQMAPGVP
jgi:hypothetical protein